MRKAAKIAVTEMVEVLSCAKYRKESGLLAGLIAGDKAADSLASIVCTHSRRSTETGLIDTCKKTDRHSWKWAQKQYFIQLCLGYLNSST